MKGLHHVGITVRDLDASIRFYHDVLGLPFSNEPSPWFEDEGLGDAVGVPGAALRQVSLLLGDTTLELLEYKSPPSDTEAPLASNNLGASHVASRPAGAGLVDYAGWGAWQFGDWYGQTHRAYGAAAQAGFRWINAPWTPWARAGCWRGWSISASARCTRTPTSTAPRSRSATARCASSTSRTPTRPSRAAAYGGPSRP